ncbi:MAG: hypothetical protein Q9160_007400 [Pyrenula sp. 1 TL-2023]
MPPPSPLAIATSSLQRLVKEEASYHAELKQQEQRIQKLQGRVEGGAGVEPEEDEEERGNREFGLRQERQALEETKKIFPGLRERIATARETLKGQLEAGASSEEDVKKAQEVLKQS